MAQLQFKSRSPYGFLFASFNFLILSLTSVSLHLGIKAVVVQILKNYKNAKIMQLTVKSYR